MPELSELSESTGSGDPLSAPARLEYEFTLFSRHGLSATQHPDHLLDRSAYVILTRLGDDALTLKELAEALRLDVSTVNRQVGRMRAQGLVERIADPDGGLARRVRATGDGRAAMRTDRASRRDGFARIVAGWPSTEIEQLAVLIAKLNASIESMEDNPWPRSSR